MRVLLAFDKFKDALTAPAACAIAAAVLRGRQPGWTLDLCPLADGGEGFCDILTRAAGGSFETFTVTGPRGAAVEAALGFVELSAVPAPARALLELGNAAGQIALVELATASGLALLPAGERDPWLTSSVGTGELVRHAADRGASAILMGVGGSATHDLGLGALGALGLKCLSGDGRPVTPLRPEHWPRLARFAGGVPASLPPLRIACDVANPLLGPQGAAAVYGPQKGLRPADLARLDHESARLALMLCAHCGRPEALMDVPGAGAAGGIAFGLVAAARARLLPGYDLVAAWLDLEARLAAADVVITGEGRFDASSLQGKGPGALAARALALGKTVHVFAGAVGVAAPSGLALHAITPAGVTLAAALRTAPENLAVSLRAVF